MEKVKLTQDQANAVELAKQMDKEIVVRRHSLDEAGSAWEDHMAPLNDLSLNNLIKALYIGYEVEITTEDKIREYYNGLLDGITGEDIDHEAHGVRTTLNLLHIKIEGVNT